MTSRLDRGGAFGENALVSVRFLFCHPSVSSANRAYEPGGFSDTVFQEQGSPGEVTMCAMTDAKLLMIGEDEFSGPLALPVSLHAG